MIVWAGLSLEGITDLHAIVNDTPTAIKHTTFIYMLCGDNTIVSTSGQTRNKNPRFIFTSRLRYIKC